MVNSFLSGRDGVRTYLRVTHDVLLTSGRLAAGGRAGGAGGAGGGGAGARGGGPGAARRGLALSGDEAVESLGGAPAVRDEVEVHGVVDGQLAHLQLRVLQLVLAEAHGAVVAELELELVRVALVAGVAVCGEVPALDDDRGALGDEQVVVALLVVVVVVRVVGRLDLEDLAVGEGGLAAAGNGLGRGCIDIRSRESCMISKLNLYLCSAWGRSGSRSRSPEDGDHRKHLQKVIYYI